MTNNQITLIGAGLAGPLMASFLAKQGFSVEIYERRSDMRKVKMSSGRSINLALSARGIEALKEVGVFENIKPFIANSILDAEFVYRKEFYGFTNKKDFKFIKITFQNTMAMKKCESKVYDMLWSCVSPSWGVWTL